MAPHSLLFFREKSMSQETYESLSDVDDNLTDNTRSKNVDVTDIANDVDTQELIRTDGTAYALAIRAEELADRKQARRFAEVEFNSRMRHQANLDNITIRAQIEAQTHVTDLNAQKIRHTDHTLIDLHSKDAGS